MRVAAEEPGAFDADRAIAESGAFRGASGDSNVHWHDSCNDRVSTRVSLRSDDDADYYARADGRSLARASNPGRRGDRARTALPLHRLGSFPADRPNGGDASALGPGTRGARVSHGSA